MMSVSGSSSSRGRSTSPFRFLKSTSNSLERLPGFISFPSIANANSPQMRITSGASSSVDSTSPVFGDAVAPAKENVCVTIRFRPLSTREIHRGDEVAWYAEGDTMVRSEYNPATAYAFDKVFGPTTTTHGVYDFAAKHVVRGAMEGINGTVFAYGVTSSGKTHTMHGDQKSPGIIPLAIKDVFSIIQETVGRDFLLRVSYLEIYNEIINDLLDPTAQNLRVREDSQGTYVEGIKEEVVLSPAHALSLIAAGEEHRHVGSNNFNLFSSRSHTIFTLTIESSSHGDSYGEVTLSQLNLIDLAGSESSKTETTGLRRKEGAYINKSLLTLGTVIAKLSDGKACHIPYRDSKLTRLLQSSLSGRGRVSLICTITPASSNMEETHNTLKFAYRAKRLELYTNPTRIIDDKSLIKKYQKQIAILKQELERVKRGYIVSASQEDLAALRQKLEAGQVKMRSRLEEEEQEKAALMGRIQRLTKLILVSTKNTVPVPASEKPTHRRRYSFGEDELAYLPVRRRDLDDDPGVPSQDLDSKQIGSNTDDIAKDEKKNKKRGMLSWFKLRKSDAGNGNPVSLVENDNHSIESPRNSVCSEPINEFQNKRGDDSTLISDSFLTPTQAGELFSVARNGRKPPPTGTTMTDQIDLLREQMKMLAGEVALTRSSLKRLTEQAACNPDDTQLKAQIQKLEMEIKEKQQHIDIIKQRMIGMGETSVDDALIAELQQTISNLTRQLDEKAFELEIKSADNRILQEQLEAKSAENMEMQGTVLKLQEQLELALTRNSHQHQSLDDVMSGAMAENGQVNRGMRFELTSSECIQGCCDEFRGQMLLQAAEVESLKQEKDQLIEEKEGLQIQGQKLSEEASYAKELASAAAVELKALAEEVTRLSYQNAKLVEKLEEARNMSLPNGVNNSELVNGFSDHDEAIDDIDAWNLDAEDLKRELRARKEREASLEATLAEKVTVEAEFVKKIDKYKRREADLENELAGMWVRIANLKKEKGISENTDIKTDVPNVVPVENGYDALINGVEEMNKDQRNEEMADDSFENQTRMCAEVLTDVSQIKIEGIAGGNFPSYEISDILL